MKNPNYYYSNKDLTPDISKMKQASKSNNCLQVNKQIFENFLSLLLTIDPKNKNNFK